MIICSKNNKYVKHTFDIIFQITLITIFLTVFFFSYVSNVEKNEFTSQINFTVNQIITDDEMRMLIPQNLTEKQKEDLSIVISGALEAAKRKSVISLQSSIDDVNKTNSIIKTNSYKLIGYIVTGVVVLCLIVLTLGYCLPNLINQFNQAVFVVFFIGLTELLFLNLITKKYISANPNKIKATIASAIKEWIKNNPTGLSK
jgi:hypothetical protein